MIREKLGSFKMYYLWQPSQGLQLFLPFRANNELKCLTEKSSYYTVRSGYSSMNSDRSVFICDQGKLNFIQEKSRKSQRKVSELLLFSGNCAHFMVGSA